MSKSGVFVLVDGRIPPPAQVWQRVSTTISTQITNWSMITAKHQFARAQLIHTLVQSLHKLHVYILLQHASILVLVFCYYVAHSLMRSRYIGHSLMRTRYIAHSLMRSRLNRHALWWWLQVHSNPALWRNDVLLWCLFHNQLCSEQQLYPHFNSPYRYSAQPTIVTGLPHPLHTHWCHTERVHFTRKPQISVAFQVK